MAQTKYAVYDAETGLNTLHDTQDAAIEAFWINVVALAKSHFHGTAYMIVEINDDGSEVWRNDDGDVIDKPKTAEEISKLGIGKHIAKRIVSPTKIETLP